MKELRGMSQPGDIVIGAVVPVHVDKMYPATIFTETPSSAICKTFRFENYQRIQALRFAVEEINKDPDLLPNITIGYQILDSCTVLQRALSGTLQLLTGHKEPVPNYRCQQAMPLAAIIGHSISTYSMMLAHILGLYRYPQISHFSTSSLLSDRTQFHSFFRTVPSDAFQCQGLAQLVLHFGWTWVGLVALDNDYGQQGIQMIKRDLLNAGACVAFTENIILNQQNRNAPQIARVIKESAAKVVVFFSTDIDLLFVLDEMLRQNISEKILVASEAWATSAFLAEDKYSKILSGTIGFALHSGTIPGFKDFLNSIHFSLSLDDELLKIFWEQAFGCQFQDQANATVTSEYSVKICTGSEDLGNIQNSYNDVSSLRVTYNVYTAVRVVAKALHDLSRCNDGEGPFCKGTCAYIGRFEPWQVPRSICSQSCPPGYSKAVLPGKPVCCFECFPCPHGEISNKTDSPYCFKCPWDMWPNIKRDSCLPKPREFLSYEDSLGETLATTSISSSLVPFAILVLFVHYKITPIVRANNYLLSCLLLVSLSLCFLCSLFFIGFPHPEMCRLRQVTFGMVFALCISCILAKTFMVVVAFKATKPNSSLKKWTRPRISYLIVVLCILIQTCLCTMWLLLSPPFFEENIRTKVGVVIVECNDGSSVAFWCMLGYLGLLASVSFFVAFLARRLPDSFNEAKFITFSMGTFLSVWISFIPATMSARGKYIVAMEIFAILSSTWALVVCMFVPKCFIILFRPNMNSREHLMGKEKRGSEKQACKQNNTTGRH
ncbi:hypothetical protein XENTR_v10010235 [Xenopus tropicalis]|nr:hypothetical protein XENTR_v10010235 [Xenopus tropicalis]